MANEKNIEAPYEENVFRIGEMENAQIRNGKILIFTNLVRCPKSLFANSIFGSSSAE